MNKIKEFIATEPLRSYPMRTFTTEQLKTIFDNHKLWLADSSQGERADLSDADLSNANLSSANLSNCDLRYANLSYANLSSANLSNADLRSADLSYANLSNLDLSNADLRNSNLRGADLSYANLRSADLSNCDLSNSDLSYADLRFANLSNTNILIFQFNKHQAIYTPDGSLKIGCHYLPITEWAETYKDIGMHGGYSMDEIEEYGKFINICLGIFNKEK